MAKKVFYQLVDDLDGSAIEPGNGETITFTVDGVGYEIDLSDANASEFRAAIERYTKPARVVSRARRGNTRRNQSAGSGRDLAAVRSWANANGHSVAERGRVPAAVIEAYDAANN